MPWVRAQTPMGWKTNIATKKAFAVVKVVLTVVGISIMNGGIEYLKVLPEDKVIVLYNKPLISVADAAEEKEVIFDRVATFTAYNTVPWQTDDSPCIAARNKNICGLQQCVVAQNGVSLGTKIEVEGIGECEVVDRKASRYDSSWIDISFDKDIQGAKNFGVKKISYRVIE